MHVITSIFDLLTTLELPADSRSRAKAVKPAAPRLAKASTLVDVAVVRTGLDALDTLLPNNGFARGTVHELLSDGGFLLPAALLARAAMQAIETPAIEKSPNPMRPLFAKPPPGDSRWVVWCDEHGELYPPALQALGIPLHRLLVLRGLTPLDALWAAAECMRCPGVGATIASAQRLSRIQTRRLQLAAERGQGLGILLRPLAAQRWPYAAASRWLVTAATGSPTVGRLGMQLIHGHGGQVGHHVLLEHNRETQHIHAVYPSHHSSHGTGGTQADSLPASAPLAPRPPGAQIPASA